MTDTITELRDQLNRIELTLQSLLQQKMVKDWYSTSEVAAILSKAEYTVSEWCRQGRINAEKKAHTRGAHAEWLISHAELTRVRNEGLLGKSDRHS